MNNPLLLLVDDDRISNLINKRIVGKVFPKYEIMDFRDPKQALAFIESGYDNFGSLCIFLDINMPELSGWDFMEILNKKIVPKDKIHIYILSSSINHLDIQKAEEFAIVKAYLSKPLTREKLLNIQKLL